MTTLDPARQEPAGGTLVFDLHAPNSGLEASVQLRYASGRWVAVSAARGHEVVSIGATARGAVGASLGWLGANAVSELLVDLCLLDVSRQVRALALG